MNLPSSDIGRAALTCAVVLCTLAGGMGGAATAQSLDDVAQVITVTPVPGWRAAPGRHVAGLHIALEPGWKTYWRSAGAAGIAPRMTWNESDGVASVAPAWPTPGLFRQGAELSIGYDGDFVLPLVVETGAGRATLRGRLDLGVCAEVCLPVALQVELPLPASGDPDAELSTALADRPRRVEARMDCLTRPTPDGMVLTGALDLPTLGGTEAVVFEVPDPALWVTDATVAREGDRLTASSELMMAGGGPVYLDKSDVRITVIGARGAVELAGCDD